MGSAPKYSVIVPVYNRPEELNELLQSLTEQSVKDFEVLIVEDGSDRSSEKIYESYAPRLAVKYFFKPNSGPGPSRNFGYERALGRWLVVFDSDCILPPDYFAAVDRYMASHPVDAWGGPDRGHENFSALQQAMAYTMSSVLTTGGIRGGPNQAERFQPRSFNMGISAEVYKKTAGFRFDRLAEDIELSIRIRREGFRIALIPEAYVYHKRRTDFRQFFRQVQGFGRGRVRVGNKYPEEVKVTHWFPVLFLLSLVALPLVYLLNPILTWIGIVFFIVYFLAIFISGWRVTRSLGVALLGVPAAWIQLTGYGIGFLKEKMKPSSRNQ